MFATRFILTVFLALLAAFVVACERGQVPSSLDDGPETRVVNGVRLIVGETGGSGLVLADDDDDDDDDEDDGDDDEDDDEDDDDSSGSGPGGRDVRYIRRSDGGRLQISGAEFSISRYSVSSSAWITMERTVNTFGIFTITFTPSGLKFYPEATLRISVDQIAGVDPRRLKVAGASSGAEDWKVLGGTYDPERRTVTIKVPHFSRYALCIE